MKTLLTSALVVVFAIVSAYADPLTPVKPKTENENPDEVASISDILKERFPKSRISIRDMKPLAHESTTALLPQGSVHRVSAVVADPLTKHAALLEFVIYKQGNDSVVLPLAGDHSEFVSLLRLLKKKIRNADDAIVVGKAFAAIYRLNLAGAPKIAQREDAYSIELTLQPGSRTKNVELNIEVDEEGNAHRSIMGAEADDPPSPETK